VELRLASDDVEETLRIKHLDRSYQPPRLPPVVIRTVACSWPGVSFATLSTTHNPV
jgi:hypothetical protein